MVTLHLLQLLADEGFGTIDTDMFFEEAPLDGAGNPKEGIWIVTRGAALSRFNTTTQSFDIYSRYSNKLTGYRKLEDILTFMQDAYGEVCELPEVPTYSTIKYENVRIRPTSGVENVGTDENNKLVRVISGEIQYERN
jgi:hypothetical protein